MRIGFNQADRMADVMVSPVGVWSVSKTYQTYQLNVREFKAFFGTCMSWSWVE